MLLLHYTLRDSAGCGRAGLLSGGAAWGGQLLSDDPLETVDEWDDPLMPNHAVVLGAGCEVCYCPSGTEDSDSLSSSQAAVTVSIMRLPSRDDFGPLRERPTKQEETSRPSTRAVCVPNRAVPE